LAAARIGSVREHAPEASTIVRLRLIGSIPVVLVREHALADRSSTRHR
jgi:hypothetical protein